MEAILNRHISPSRKLHLRSYGAETLLFHSGTGDTLLLHPFAVPVLDILRRPNQNLRVSELLAEVARVQNYELDDDFSVYTSKIIMELAAADVVILQ